MEDKYLIRINKLFDLYDEGEIERAQFINKLNTIYGEVFRVIIDEKDEKK